jgi:hypothetical protein
MEHAMDPVAGDRAGPEHLALPPYVALPMKEETPHGHPFGMGREWQQGGPGHHGKPKTKARFGGRLNRGR